MINEKKTKEFLENKNNTFELDLEFLEEKKMKLAEKIQFELLYKHGAYSPVPFEKLVLKKFDSVIEARKALYEKLKSIPYLTLPERYKLTKETNLNKEAILCTEKISVCLVIKEVVNTEEKEKMIKLIKELASFKEEIKKTKSTNQELEKFTQIYKKNKQN